MADLHDAHTEQPEFKGKRVLVTGGATGIGRAIGVLLASYGAKIFTCGRNAQHLEDALKRMREVGDAEGMTADLSKPQELDAFYAAAHKHLGGVDIAVLNAGVPAEGALDMDETELRTALETDLTSQVVGARKAAKLIGKGGDIIFVGSMAAVSKRGGASVYVAAKSGLQGFAKSLREVLGEQDIKVGLIEPGFTGADFQLPDYPPEKQRELIADHRMLRAEDIAAAVYFMLAQPRRTAVSLMRVETRRKHPES
jgi:3-oxoacyl-[acyl-carrier protein] reductase